MCRDRSLSRLGPRLPGRTDSRRLDRARCRRRKEPAVQRRTPSCRPCPDCPSPCPRFRNCRHFLPRWSFARPTRPLLYECFLPKWIFHRRRRTRVGARRLRERADLVWLDARGFHPSSKRGTLTTTFDVRGKGASRRRTRGRPEPGSGVASPPCVAPGSDGSPGWDLCPSS
jgi:hypothetical protein